MVVFENPEGGEIQVLKGPMEPAHVCGSALTRDVWNLVYLLSRKSGYRDVCDLPLLRDNMV